jgi:hypothetical protein
MLIETVYSTDQKTLKAIKKLNEDWETFEALESSFQGKLDQLQQELKDIGSNRKTDEIMKDIREVRLELIELARTEIKLLTSKIQILEPAIQEQTEAAARLKDSVPAEIEKAKERLEAAGCGIETIPAGGTGIGRLVSTNRPAAEIKFNHMARQTETVRELLSRVSEVEGRSRTLIQQKANTSLSIDSAVSRFQQLVERL